MSVFLGNTGNVRLRRGSTSFAGAFSDRITPDDVNTTLNRLGLDKSLDNLVTGDRIDISTSDTRGLVCFPASTWSSNVVENTISAYVNVNAMGGLRFFNSFSAAVNNDRSVEYPLAAFAGDQIDVEVAVRDVSYGVLGSVTSYELNTSRDAVDTTSLTDKFKTQYSAGLISGSGRVECLFDYKSTGLTETPLFVLQTILRVDIGSHCDLALYVLDKSNDPAVDSVYYELEAVITSSGIFVDVNNAITCTIDFVTTGEIKLRVGQPSGYILKEDDDRIRLQQSLDFLLTEVED